MSEEAALNRNQDESRDAKEITATIYSIVQVPRMSNLQTRAQLRAVEQSFNIHHSLLSLNAAAVQLRLCVNVQQEY